MSKIQLDDNYFIETDAYNFTLKFAIKHNVTKINKETNLEETKEVTSKGEYHFPTLKGALLKYIDECTRPLATISGIIEELKRIETLISKLN